MLHPPVLLRELSDGSVDCCAAYGTEALAGGYGFSHQRLLNDTDLSALSGALPEAVRVLRDGAWVAVFCAARQRPVLDALLIEAGLTPFGEIIWDKRKLGLRWSIPNAQRASRV